MARWTPYPDFPNHYAVSEAGNIKSLATGKVIKQHKWKAYRKKVWLTVDGERHMRYVHRMVAETFIPNPDNLGEVNHINGNRYDNRVANLEWISPEENKLHAKENNLHNNPSGRLAKNFKGVIIGHMICDGEKKTVKMAGKADVLSKGYDYNAVLAVLAGRQKTHKGFTFKRKGI